MKKKLLAKKSLWWYVTYPFAWIFWKLTIVTPMENKKSWQEFNLGRITHTCKFEGRFLVIKGIKFDECSHYGCYTVREHEHGPYIEAFRTGDPTKGKDEVARCARCNDLFVRLYGQKEYNAVGKGSLTPKLK